MKNSVKPNRKKTNGPVEMWARDFTKEDLWEANKRRRKLVSRQWPGGNPIFT